MTVRQAAPIGLVPGVTCVPAAEAAGAALVVDTTGRPEWAAELVAPEGTLGLLGTPGPTSTLPALAAHRGGWTILGMHELASADHDAYQQTCTDTARWLTGHVEASSVASWCRTLPGRDAPQVLGLLTTPQRPAEPVLIFEWDR
ncbi:hypothetical protein ACSCBZ_20455 [Streptomyces niveiscabiei]|uniref:hypothetical protein n=1 Tax=Streptomyces TaxID=1883 RepID=UPI001F0B7A2F|nr:hypothetical protein [Streptomyces sp. V2]